MLIIIGASDVVEGKLALWRLLSKVQNILDTPCLLHDSWSGIPSMKDQDAPQSATGSPFFLWPTNCLTSQSLRHILIFGHFLYSYVYISYFIFNCSSLPHLLYVIHSIIEKLSGKAIFPKSIFDSDSNAFEYLYPRFENYLCIFLANLIKQTFSGEEIKEHFRQRV